MVEPVSVILFGLGFLVGAALVLWPQILDFVRHSLTPWIDRHLPFLSDFVRDAFSALDQVATRLRTAIKNAWRKIRPFLLKSLITFSRYTSSVWLKIATSFLIKILESGQRQPVKVTTQETCSWDEIPDDVRESFLRSNRDSFEENVTAQRDTEMEQFA